MTSREHIATLINTTLVRLPLVLEILEEIGSQRRAGDEDLKYGATRAVSSMIARLEGIAPATEPEPYEFPGDAEQLAYEWLLGNRPSELLPTAEHRQLTEIIVRLLPASGTAVPASRQSADPN